MQNQTGDAADYSDYTNNSDDPHRAVAANYAKCFANSGAADYSGCDGIAADWTVEHRERTVRRQRRRRYGVRLRHEPPQLALARFNEQNKTHPTGKMGCVFDYKNGVKLTKISAGDYPRQPYIFIVA